MKIEIELERNCKDSAYLYCTCRHKKDTAYAYTVNPTYINSITIRARLDKNAETF